MDATWQKPTQSQKIWQVSISQMAGSCTGLYGKCYLNLVTAKRTELKCFSSERSINLFWIIKTITKPNSIKECLMCNSEQCNKNKEATMVKKGQGKSQFIGHQLLNFSFLFYTLVCALTQFRCPHTAIQVPGYCITATKSKYLRCTEERKEIQRRNNVLPLTLPT